MLVTIVLIETPKTIIVKKIISIFDISSINKSSGISLCKLNNAKIKNTIPINEEKRPCSILFFKNGFLMKEFVAPTNFIDFMLNLCEYTVNLIVLLIRAIATIKSKILKETNDLVKKSSELLDENLKIIEELLDTINLNVVKKLTEFKADIERRISEKTDSLENILIVSINQKVCFNRFINLE